MLTNIMGATKSIDFNKCVRLNKIIASPNFDKFTNIMVDEIPEVLPINIKHLTFAVYFNEPIKHTLPNSITHLDFGYKFNKSIENVIPRCVKYLTFGKYFNQPITDVIPHGVTHLSFGNNFNQSIKGAIPDSVICLTFGANFIQPIINVASGDEKITSLATFLEHLEILERTCITSFNRMIPTSVENLVIPKIYSDVVAKLSIPSVFFIDN